MHAALCWVLLRASCVTAHSLAQGRQNALRRSLTLRQWQAGWHSRCGGSSLSCCSKGGSAPKKTCGGVASGLDTTTDN